MLEETHSLVTPEGETRRKIVGTYIGEEMR